MCAALLDTACAAPTWNTAPRGVAAAEPTPTPASMAWDDSMPRTYELRPCTESHTW